MNECKYFSSNVNIYRESESVCICSVTVQYRTYIAKEHKPLYIYIYIEYSLGISHIQRM